MKGARLLAVLLVLRAGTALAGEPTELIAKANAELLDLIAKDAPPEQLAAKLHPLLDVRELARRALVDHARDVSADEVDQIVILLGRLLDRSYLAQIRSRAKYTIEYRGERDAGAGDVLVKAVVHARAKGRETEIQVGYLVHEGGAGYRIVDLITDEVSLLGNYRSQFDKIIAKEGARGLIARMRKKLGADEEP